MTVPEKRNRIGATCFLCDKRRSTGLFCEVLNMNVGYSIYLARPFCPLYKHGKIIWRDRLQWLDKYIIGAANVVWFLLRQCRPLLPTIMHRLAACGSCEHNKRISWLRYCGQCGCWLRAKVRLSYQRCPIGRWEAAKQDSCRPPMGLKVLQKGCCNGNG